VPLRHVRRGHDWDTRDYTPRVETEGEGLERKKAPQAFWGGRGTSGFWVSLLKLCFLVVAERALRSSQPILIARVTKMIGHQNS
jgi:hypothetical protein